MGLWAGSPPAWTSTDGSWWVAGSGGVRPGMMGDGILLQVRVGRRTLRDPMDHLLQKHAFGIFGATWGIININKLNAEACGKTDTWDAWGSERKHGADEAYGQSERVERWAHFKREKGRAFARRRCGFFKLRYHQRCTPSSFRSPTATEDSVLGGEPWGCQ